MDNYVYILSNEHLNVLYIGVTNNLTRRLAEHRSGIGSDFTRRYNVHRLVYFETCQSVADAIAREKQLKGWSRRKKDALIESLNPTWSDLAPSLS